MALKLEINLIELLKGSFPDSRLRRALTPVVQSPSVSKEFGKRVIDKILERTNTGIDKDGRRFKAYSQSYQKTLVWKVYGKTTTPVNLKLTGQMQAGLRVLDARGGSVVIGFPDSTLDKRAQYHVSLGVKSKQGLVFRDFFGLPQEEQKKILKEIIVDNANKTADIQLGGPIEAITGLTLGNVSFEITRPATVVPSG